MMVLTFSIVAAYAQEKQDSLATPNKPKATYQMGSVKVTVWENPRNGKYGEYTDKTYKVEKVYKKGEEWKTTNNFDTNELLQLRAVLDKAIGEEAVKVKEGKKEEKEVKEVK